MRQSDIRAIPRQTAFDENVNALEPVSSNYRCAACDEEIGHLRYTLVTMAAPPSADSDFPVTSSPATQLSIDGIPCPISVALDKLAEAEGVDERGAIFTRREVVDFILDLSGYVVENELNGRRMLEPSFGGGDFLIPAVERLVASWRRSRHRSGALSDLSNCIRAVELHRSTFDATRTRLIECLRSQDIDASSAARLAGAWLIQSDFLLTSLEGNFDIVVGNPPYVRQELIPGQLLAEYRARYESVYDRADLYVPFIERSLSLLAPRGNLAFICADRWMKNRYGGPLRRIVSSGFHLKIYVDMANTPAFQSDVIAYPAITVISREKSGPTRIARQPEISAGVLSRLSKKLTSRKPGAGIVELSGVTEGDAPWLLDGDGRLGLVRALEDRFPALEEAGCKVGIGVATGSDKTFIAPFDKLDVEDDRKLPLVMTRDILHGKVEWRGLGVINPFSGDGALVRLEDYPRLRAYLEARRDVIAGRHVAQRIPANWYRTIDRIYPALASRPKLLIPDIKGEAHIVYEKGGLYPHHNLYHITSDTWDLEALQAILKSGIARLFVAAYSTKMRGGYLRFQAQYLRRIRVPRWEDVPGDLRKKLQVAARTGDEAVCDKAAIQLYGLSRAEARLLKGSG